MKDEVHMKLNNKELYNKFKNEGIEYLYHANTLSTALGFIENGGLYSRGEMERRGIFQTYQNSDSLDKKYGIWDDIFLDTVDLHGYIFSGHSRQNLYGPILFVMSIDLLLDSEYDNVWITTNNPTKWLDCDESKNYFSDIETYMKSINTNRQQKMLTIRNLYSYVDFENYLVKILIDDPFRSVERMGAFDYCKDKINRTLRDIGLNCPVLKHNCRNSCYCHGNYSTKGEEDFHKLFIDLT